MLIRPEHPDDHQAIHDLTAAAFAPMAFSDGTEPALIGQLRDAGDLTLSLVAEEGGAIIGHAAFSPARISAAKGNWYALGPISVRRDRQRQGIGRALIEAGLTNLSERGAAGCVLTGNPDLYQRVGFICDGNLHHAGTADKYVLWRVLNGTPPHGTITFAPAFEPQVYIAPDVADVIALHPYLGDPAFRAQTIRKQLGQQAETIHAAHQNGDTRISVHALSWWPGAAGKDLDQIMTGPFTPEDAHTTIAREYGYNDWTEVPSDPLDITFETALDTLLRGHIGPLDRMLDERPGLVHQRSAFGHGATLLHYLGSNGVESHRQVVPLNAYDVARHLINKGADPRATMQVYGGPQTPLDLASTSAHPIGAGIAAALNAALTP